jgi:hypothetical protein
MDFLNMLRKKPVKTTGQNTKVREISKQFCLFIKESKEALKTGTNDKSPLTGKARRSSCKDVLADNAIIKQRINEYIKANFKEKGYKSDAKSFFLLLAEEYYKLISGILIWSQGQGQNSSISNDTIISFFKNFYDFEDELYVSNREVIEKIEKSEESYIITLLKCLSYVKLCDSVEYLLDKDNDIQDIGAKTVLVMYDFQKINKYLNSIILQEGSGKEESKIFAKHIQKAINNILPYFVDLFSKLINDPSMKTVFLLMESGDLSKLFNDLSSMKVIRNSIYDIFIKVNTYTKDGIKIRSFRKYVSDFNCLEGMFSCLRNSYRYFPGEYSDLHSEVLKEALNILIIINGFYEDQKDLKKEIYSFLISIFEDLVYSQDLENFISKSSNLVKEVFYLCYVDREDIKNKIYDKSLRQLDCSLYLVNTFNNYKDISIIEFLLDLFEYIANLTGTLNSTSSILSPRFNLNQNNLWKNSEISGQTEQNLFSSSNKVFAGAEKNVDQSSEKNSEKEKITLEEKTEFLKKSILLCLLGEEPSLNKYKFLVYNTSYCNKILENLYKYSEEIISYPLNTLLITLSDSLTSNPGQNNSSTFGQWIHNEKAENNFNMSTSINNMSYVPEKELKAIIKSLPFCEKEETLTNILKHLKTFLDFSPTFQKLLVNCGIFNKLLEILDKTLDILEYEFKCINNNSKHFFSGDGNFKKFNSSSVNSKNIFATREKEHVHNSHPHLTRKNTSSIKFSPTMIMSILSLVELILSNNQENTSTFKSYYLLDNYFDNFTLYPDYKGIAYKIWNISMTYESDPNEMVKYTKFLLRRYYVLKESLRKSENIKIYKNTLQEIFRVNEIICVNFLNENLNNLLHVSGNNNDIFLKEILLDFVNLLKILKFRKLQEANLHNDEMDHIINNYKLTCSKTFSENREEIINSNFQQIEEDEKVKVLETENYNSNNSSPKEDTHYNQTDQNEQQIHETNYTIYWDIDLQNIIKSFFKNFINLIFHFNKNLFNLKFKNSKLGLNKLKMNRNLDPFIKKEDLKFVIEKTIQFLNEIKGKNFLLDFVKFLIDSSLRFKLNERNVGSVVANSRKVSENMIILGQNNYSRKHGQNDNSNFENEIFTLNLLDYYKDTFNVEESYLNNSYTSISNYSNFILQSPMIIKIILSSLKKTKNYQILYEFLQFLDFLCKVNENNIKILMKHKLVKNLLDIFRKIIFKFDELENNINNNQMPNQVNLNSSINLNLNANPNLNYTDTSLRLSNISFQGNAIGSGTQFNLSYLSEIKNKVIEIFEIITKFMNKSDLENLYEFLVTGVAFSKNLSSCSNNSNHNNLNIQDNLSSSINKELSFKENSMLVQLPNCNPNPNGQLNQNFNSPSIINIINRLMTIFHKNYLFSRKIKKNIILSSIITRQPNIYNMLYTGNIKITQPSLKEIPMTLDIPQNSKKSCSVPLSIFLNLKFHKAVGNSFTLFKLEKEISKDYKEKEISSFEVVIEHNILIVKDNEKEVYNCDELTKFIRIDKNMIFLFVLDKDTNSMEIYINEKLLYAPSIEFKFLENINSSTSYSLTTGYAGSATQELYQDTFQNFPHVSLSHFMMYSDKITKENMIHFKLSQVFSSKNGSVRANTIKLKYLNKKSYKVFAPHYINQKEILKYVRLNIEPEKVIYELVADKFEILSNNKVTAMKTDSTICNSFIYKINRKFNIDLLEKDFLVYVPNTNYGNFEGLIGSGGSSSQGKFSNFFNNTYMLSKINISESIYLNQIFDMKILKRSILSQIIGIHADSILDCSVQSFNTLNYLIMILNEIGDILNSNLLGNSNVNNLPNLSNSYTQLLTNTLKLISLYLISNLHELNEFNPETETFKAFLITLYKISKLLTPEMIDYIVNLSFGVQDLTGINVFNPWYPKIITEILLDIHLFRLLSNEIKMYVLTKLMSFLNQKDYIFIMYEANIETKVSIISRLYKIFMLIELNEEIDEKIINLINSLLDQTLKFKKGDVEPSEEQLNRIISSTQEFFFICGHFNESITNHLKTKDFDSNGLNTTLYLVKKYYAKLFNESTKNLMEKIFGFFTKIREDIIVNRSQLGRRGTSLNVGVKVGHLLNSNFFKKLYNQAGTEKSYNKILEELEIKKEVENLRSSQHQKNYSSGIFRSSSRKTAVNPSAIKNFLKTETSYMPSSVSHSPDQSFRHIQQNQSNPRDDLLNLTPLYKSINFIKKDFADVDKENWTLVSSFDGSNPISVGDEYIHSELTGGQTFKLTSANFDADFECIGSECFLCNFFRDSILNSYKITKNFNSFTKYVKNFLYQLYLKSPSKKLTDLYFKSKGINFAWYILNREGPSRIRNKLIAKIDEIKNEELNKKYYEDLEKLIQEEKLHKISPLNNIFNFMDIKDIFSEVLFTDQIFNLNIIKNLVDEDDKYIAAFNCLHISECYQMDCVFVLGSNKFYILQNLHIDSEGNLQYAKKKFKKHFWVVNDYKKEWNRACPYLNNYAPPKENSVLVENENKEIDTNMTNVEQIGNLNLSNINQNLNSNHIENQSDAKRALKVDSTINLNNLNFETQFEMSNAVRKICDEIKMYKFSRSRKGIKIYSYKYNEINELHKRRFLLKQNALEFFMKSGENLLLSFNLDKRDQVFSELVKGISNTISKKGLSFSISNSMLNSNTSFYTTDDKIVVKKHKGLAKRSKLKGLVEYKQIIEEASDGWAQGVISNYSYLMLLNTLAGRSYTDISQYLVMPWIIKDYYSEGLNLNTDEIYRNLSHPIHALDENTRKNLKQKYYEAEESDKFHSGSHYSTPGFVCYYLIRLKPYSYISAEIQGGYFDMADRLFFNIKSLWDVSDKYQELVPEMYYLPEIFMNYNEFNFGNTQNQIAVSDVMLPNWAKGDPRLFVKLTKKALESAKVSQRISEWIDLIFGYKQQGNEAINNLNTFRSLCYEGRLDFNEYKKKEIDDKMVEIHDFGQIPTMLFSKQHPKKERHEKSSAFFAKPSYLMHFLPREKTFNINLSSKPKEIKGYSEISEYYLSHGEGGISSFKIYQNDSEEKHAKTLDAMNTFTIIGGKGKILLGPKFINFIDFSYSKYSFLLVKPHCKMAFEFFTHRDSPISDIKPTLDGKRLIISFEDGVVCLWKIRKEKDKIIHPEFDKKKEKSIFKIFAKKDSFSSAKKPSSNTTSFTVNPTQSAYSFKNKDLNSGLQNMNTLNEVRGAENYNTTYTQTQAGSNNHFNQSKPVPQIPNYSSSNLKQIIFPTLKYFNADDEWRDIFVHHNQSGCNIQKNHSKGTSFCTLSFLRANKLINNKLKITEVCESFSLLILVDEMDYVYIFDLNKFKLMREIDYPKITKNLGFGCGSIKSIQICGLTGDFLVISNYSVIMFNVNGVLIGYMNLKEYDINNQIGKITYALVKSLRNTESEIHLFTGHETGTLFMWRLQLNKVLLEEGLNGNTITNTSSNVADNFAHSILDSYRYAYNRQYYYSKSKTFFDLKMKFVLVNEFTTAKKNIPLRLIKLTEDSSMLIAIHDDLSVTYFNYTDYFNKKIKNKPSIKFCPQCNSQLGSSKYVCSLCDKKLCSQCRLEVRKNNYFVILLINF